MKKILSLVLFTLLVNIGSLYATYLENLPVTVEQPDGTELNLFATGDEAHNWMHDADNFTVIKDSATGYYVYAINNTKGGVSPSNFIVGQTNPKEAGLTTGINLSSALIQEKIAQFKTVYVDPTLRKKKANASFTNGYLNQIVVFIQFAGDADFEVTNEAYNSTFNATDSKSVKNFFSEMSGGEMNVSSYFYPQTSGVYPITYVDSHPRSYYEKSTTDGYNDDATERRLREHELLKNASEYIASQVPTNIDFDGNNDGNVDNVVFIVSADSKGWSDLIWPHRWSLYTHNVSINGLRVYDYNFLTLNGVGAGVVSHELFHSFGAPDLYRYSDNTISPCGSWDLMASGDWNNPRHTSVYYKQKFGGWGTETPTISTPGTYTLEPVSTNPFAAYKIPIPNSTTEFLMVEYRKKEGLYESYLPGQGLVIYRVNTAVNGNGNGPDDEIYFFRPGGGLTVNGSINSAGFSATYDRTSFNDATDPALFLSDGSAGGFVASLGISNVTVIGSTISFDYNKEEVSGGCSAAEWASSAVYNTGDLISYQNHEWSAKWWTQNNTPGTEQYGPWEDLGTCAAPVDPTVQILNPTNGETIYVSTATVDITVDVNDEVTTIDSVFYVINSSFCNGPGCNEVSQRAATSAPFTLTYTPPLDANFTSIRAIAFSNGVASEESEVTVTYVAEPTVTITSPTDGEDYIVTTPTIDITVDVNDDVVSIDSVRFIVIDILCNGPGCADVNYYSSTVAPYTLTLPPTFNTNYTQIIAIAFSNGRASQESTISLNFVKQEDVLVLESPASNANLTINTGYDFSVDLSDVIGTVTSVTYTFEGSDTTEQTVTTTPFTLTWGFSEQGNYTARATATTTEGNVTSDDILFSVVSPTVAITTPTDGEDYIVTTPTVDITVDVNDDQISIDSVRFIVIDILCNGPGCADVNYYSSTVDPYTLALAPTFNTSYTQIIAIAFSEGQASQESTISLNFEEQENTCTIAKWDVSTAYDGGDQAVVNGVLYEAKWWTLGNDPEQNSGAYDMWLNLGTCGSSNARMANLSTQEVISVSPNPTNEDLTIKANGTVDIYNLLGNKVASYEVDEELEISISNWETGIYIIKIGSSDMIRFIKE